MKKSKLSKTLKHICYRSAAAVVARGRLSNPAFNAALLRRLSASPGAKDSLLSEPIFEVARVWEQATEAFGDLDGGLLHPQLVAALDSAETERMPRDRRPYTHQIAAWRAARDGSSCLVTSGTGSGKTECFMVPVLDDLLRDQAKGRLVGVRAIIIYPLNALIESQRERLSAWTEGLKDRITFALYNGLTPETPREIKRPPGPAELGDRRTIRDKPPAILITNVTMLEYLLLRAKDLPLLERSQGLLRWIVLDEAHGYIGAQAAEMALLLRRVRAAFGVKPDQVRLMATSATISDGGTQETETKLKRFVSDLANVTEDRVKVIEGRETEPVLPPPGQDTPIDVDSLAGLSPFELWRGLAPHPRLRQIRLKMKTQGLRLSEISEILGHAPGDTALTQTIIDAAARAEDPASPDAASPTRLLPWRAHLFHRAQGGVWACVNPICTHRDPELVAADSGWGFGAVWLAQRDRCACGAPAFEIVACTECGTPHLIAGRESGAFQRLAPLRTSPSDEFTVDEEPDPEGNDLPTVHDTVWLRPARGTISDRHLNLNDGVVYDNQPPAGATCVSLDMIEDAAGRACCASAANAGLQPQRYGAPFFMGNALPELLEQLARPLPKPGLPMGGRRAISFTDSRQGVARLAAKLQQDAERTLTRAFLYHSVQESKGPSPEERVKLERKLELYRTKPEDFAEEIASIERQLEGASKPVLWDELINRLGGQPELREFATRVWSERAYGGREMAENPAKLAEMFLYRELFRRPRVQNNAETMGLVRLLFPTMEERARASVPPALQEAGVNAEAWAGLAQSAVDSMFRDSLAIHIADEWMVRWVSPRWGRLQAVVRADLAPGERPPGTRSWPGPIVHGGRPSTLLRLVYRLLRGDRENRRDQDLAREVLTALWSLITSTAATDSGRGAWRLDFGKAAVARVDQGWLCPITRRILGYTTGGPSPYGTEDPRELTPVFFPRLPYANAGGLDSERREAAAEWCAANPSIASLRKRGLWSDLHDRVAVYPPFLRTQEHSAQIERPVLQLYEERFKQGEINLLNCSTTMEMGVDIPNVSLVANSNVPPSVSNYRQRVGRAGRRGEPWAFAATFCRDLPLDHVVFQDPLKFLTARMAAPAVRLDSAQVVARHVHAALLGSFLRTHSQGLDVKSSTGAFFGAVPDFAAPVTEENSADSFVACLRDPSFAEAHALRLHDLVRGTALEHRESAYLCAGAAEAMEVLLHRWRLEFTQLLERASTTMESEVRQALEMRAKRMQGEFLLSELARRGFTPSYGFPVDVVRFDHLSGHRRDTTESSIAFGDHRGGASRTLDVAIREYAPGSEVVIDGLVHESEGIQPAWTAMVDASGLEDLQFFWECRSCRGFGISRTAPENCLQCNAAGPQWHKILRPAGFLGRRAPHTGYEKLGTVPFEMPRISAAGAPWQALPDPSAGRFRASSSGFAITQSSGPHRSGYALCLCCGRAEAETDELGGPFPSRLKDHKPLAPLRAEQLVRGSCPGGLTQPQRIQRNIRLAHETHTDVFELQMPQAVTREQALALAAGLREALAERLGAEAREIGLAAGASTGPAGESCVSAFLFDRAAGGAGLVTRLLEFDWLKTCLGRAVGWLDCSEKCEHGCPGCILRPDLNFGEAYPDRPGALATLKAISQSLNLPPNLQAFGADTRLVGLPITEWFERRRLAGSLRSLDVYLHGATEQWDLAQWPLATSMGRLSEAGVNVTFVLPSASLTSKALEMAQKLNLYRLASRAKLAQLPSLPMIGEAPVLAVARIGSDLTAMVSSDPAEAIPGPDWGLGQRTPLVCGPFNSAPTGQEINPERLVALSSGNARLIWLGSEIDGTAAGFGNRFWKTIEAADPAAITALKAHGVSRAIYSDRYLLTPLNLKLLHEISATLPGRPSTQILEIETAVSDRLLRNSNMVFHSFPDDGTRRAVLSALFPGAKIGLTPKNHQPHARSLVLHLGDGRRLRILLDQGLGAWRCMSISSAHDFRAPPQKQAGEIKNAKVDIRMGEAEGTPAILEFG